MRYIILLVLALFIPLRGTAEELPEIVIEITGTAQSAQQEEGLNLWDISPQQLTHWLQDKTREEVLYQVQSVSTKDTLLRAPDGTRYAFVQYGGPLDYRKILFSGKEPQSFIACASSAKEAVALFEQYEINPALTLHDFQTAYPGKISLLMQWPTQRQSLYQLSPKNANPQFLLFQNNLLLRTLSAQEAQALQTPAPKPTTPEKPAPKQPQKILVTGGTLWEQIYLPRLIERPANKDEKNTSSTQPKTPNSQVNPNMIK